MMKERYGMGIGRSPIGQRDARFMRKTRWNIEFDWYPPSTYRDVLRGIGYRIDSGYDAIEGAKGVIKAGKDIIGGGGIDAVRRGVRSVDQLADAAERLVRGQQQKEFGISAYHVHVAARPHITFDKAELHFLHEKTSLPGKPAWEPLSLTFYDLPTNSEVARWVWRVYNYGKPRRDAGPMLEPWKVKCNGYLNMLDGQGQLLQSWILYGCWPEDVDWGGLEYGDSDTADVNVTIAYSNAELRYDNERALRGNLAHDDPGNFSTAESERNIVDRVIDKLRGNAGARRHDPGVKHFEVPAWQIRQPDGPDQTASGMGIFHDAYSVRFKRKFRWHISIPGITSGGDVEAAASNVGVIDGSDMPPDSDPEELLAAYGPLYAAACSRPKLSFEEIEVAHVSEVVTFWGKPRWEPVQVTFYDIRRDDPIWRWILVFYQPYGEDGESTGLLRTATFSHNGKVISAKRPVEMRMVDATGAVIDGWRLEGAWPVSIDWGDLDFASSEVCTISVTLRYDRAAYMVSQNGGFIPAILPGYAPEDIDVQRTAAVPQPQTGVPGQPGGAVRNAVADSRGTTPPSAFMGSGPGGGPAVWGGWDGSPGLAPSNIVGFPHMRIPAGPDAGRTDKRFAGTAAMRAVAGAVAGDERKSRAFIMASRLHYGVEAATMASYLVRLARGEDSSTAAEAARREAVALVAAGGDDVSSALRWARAAFGGMGSIPGIQDSGIRPIAPAGPIANTMEDST